MGNSISRYQLRNKEIPECVFDTKNTSDDGTSLTNNFGDTKSLYHIQAENPKIDVEMISKQQHTKEIVPASQDKLQGKCTGDLNICTTTSWKTSLSANNNGTSTTFTLPYQMREIHTSATVVANRTDNANSTILQCTVVLENTPQSS